MCGRKQFETADLDVTWINVLWSSRDLREKKFYACSVSFQPPPNQGPGGPPGGPGGYGPPMGGPPGGPGGFNQG